MAISPEQKKAVKKRYEEIVAAGIPEGPDKQKLLADALKLDEKGFATAAQRAAAQQAYKEVVTDADKKQEKLQEDILASQEQTAKLAATRSTYTGQRAEALEKAGLTPEVARARAQKEFETTYATPVTSPYGTLGERKPDKILGVVDIPAAAPVQLQKEAGLGTSLSAQTSLPQSAKGTEATRLNKPAMLQVAGPGPDFEKIKTSLMDGGLSSDEASKHLVAMKSAYDVNLARKSAEYAGKPFPKNFPLTVWEETVSELGGIPKALENKESYIKDPAKAGSKDPWIAAFSKQVSRGEGVPNLSAAQGKYIETLSNEEIKNNRKKLDAQYAGKPLIVDRTEVSEVRGGSRPITKKVELKGAEREAELDRMAREGVEKPFWTDPEEVKRRLQNPEKYTQPGVFSDTSAFGTQQESTLGWLVRGAMAPLNVAAEGMYTAAMTGFGSETRSAVAEARRRARPAAYKDSPYLLNIAEGRGFVGNAQELADITGLNKDVLVNLPVVGDITLGTVYVGGNLAADLLDPSLDILAGATKGVKVAADIARTGASLGMDLKTVGKLALKEGGKDALKTIARENAATNLIASRMKTAPGDVRLILSEKIADDYLKGAQAPEGAAKPKVIEEIEKQENAFAKLGKEVDAGEIERIISKDDLKRAVTEAYVRNPDVRAKIAAVESAARAAGKSIEAERIALITGDQIVNDAVWEALVRQTVRENVFKATADSALESGLIALTRKTFATEDVANKIMKDIADSNVINIVNDIKSKPGNYTYKAVQIPGPGATVASTKTVVEGYKIDDNIRDVFIDELGRLSERGMITPQKLDAAITNLKNDFVSAETLRTIIDSNIDEAATKYRIATGENIKQLSPTVSKELTKPLELRDFSNAGLKNWLLDKKLNRPLDAMTPMQKAFVDEVVGKLSKLDVKLRDDVNLMLKNADFRAAYGVPEGKIPTRKEALGYLIVGPESAADAEYLNRTLKLTMDKMFTSDKYLQDIFDVFQGIKVDNTSDIWNLAGKQKLEEAISKASAEIINDPGVFEDELKLLIDEVSRLASDESLLKADTGVVKKAKGDVINQLLISSYYTSESNNIIRQSLDGIVRNDFGYINKRFDDMSKETKDWFGIAAPKAPTQPTFVDDLTVAERSALETDLLNINQDVDWYQNQIKILNRTSPGDPAIARYTSLQDQKILEGSRIEDKLNAAQDKFEAAMKKYESSVKKFETDKITKSGPAQFGEIVADYIKHITNDPNFKKLPIDVQLQKISKTAQVFAPGDINIIREIMSEVNDTAKAVLRNNNIPEMGTPVEDLMDVVKRAAMPDSDIAVQMDAILGKNVSKQIREALSASGQANVQAGLNKLLAEAADSYIVPKVGIRIPPMKSIPGKIWDNIMSAFYTLLLTAAPRFHGGNIFGAPGVVYSTTGKLISPLPIPGTSTWDSLQMLRKAATGEGGKIIVKDAAGRGYTADEIYKILVERGGETVNAAQIPAVQSRAALAAINEGKTGVIDRTLSWSLELPQNEDLMYRGAVLIDSLKEGRSIEQAADLAKAALYDKGTILEAEKNLQRSIMFYAFTRNNLVNLLKNISTVKGWKRIANVEKLKRGVETSTLSDEERKYLPSSAATRIVVGKAGKGDTEYVVALPSDSTLSALELLSSIIAGDLSGIAQGAMTPAQSLFYAQKDEREIENVPAEHIALFSQLDPTIEGDPTTIASLIAGEQIVPYKSNEPGNIDGYVYPLLSEKARSRYKMTINLLGYIGLSRLMSDAPNSFRAPGSKVAQAYDSGNVAQDGGMTAAYAIGLMTPLKSLSAEKQRLKTLIMQNAEGKKMIKDIDDVLAGDKLAPIKESDVSGQSAEVKAGKTEARKQILALDDTTQEFRRLAQEIGAIESRLRSGSLSEEEINILVAQIEKKAARMDELDRLYKITEKEAAGGMIPSRPLPPRPF